MTSGDGNTKAQEYIQLPTYLAAYTKMPLSSVCSMGSDLNINGVAAGVLRLCTFGFVPQKSKRVRRVWVLFVISEELHAKEM